MKKWKREETTDSDIPCPKCGAYVGEEEFDTEHHMCKECVFAYMLAPTTSEFRSWDN